MTIPIKSINIGNKKLIFKLMIAVKNSQINKLLLSNIIQWYLKGLKEVRVNVELISSHPPPTKLQGYKSHFQIMLLIILNLLNKISYL